MSDSLQLHGLWPAKLSIPTSVGWQVLHATHCGNSYKQNVSGLLFITRLGLMMRMKATFCVFWHPSRNPGLFGLCWVSADSDVLRVLVLPSCGKEGGLRKNNLAWKHFLSFFFPLCFLCSHFFISPPSSSTSSFPFLCLFSSAFLSCQAQTSVLLPAPPTDIDKAEQGCID